MATTKEMLEEAQRLLSTDWKDEDKVLIKKMIDSLVSYKSLIPRGLRQDITSILQMATRIKSEYDELLLKYKNTQDSILLEQIKDDIQELQQLEENVQHELEMIENNTN